MFGEYWDINLAICWKILLNGDLPEFSGENSYPEIISRKDFGNFPKNPHRPYAGVALSNKIWSDPLGD